VFVPSLARRASVGSVIRFDLCLILNLPN